MQSVETRRHPGQTDAEAHQIQPLVEGTHIVIRIMMMMMMLSMKCQMYYHGQLQCLQAVLKKTEDPLVKQDLVEMDR